MVKKLYPDHTANQELGMELRSPTPYFLKGQRGERTRHGHWEQWLRFSGVGRMEAPMFADQHEGHAFIHSLTRPFLSACWVLEITA